MYEFEHIKGYSTLVIRVKVSESGRVVGSFSFAPKSLRNVGSGYMSPEMDAALEPAREFTATIPVEVRIREHGSYYG